MDIMREWYYADNGEAIGPVSAEFLHTLAQNGVLRSDSMVWRIGTASWCYFSEAFPDILPWSKKEKHLLKIDLMAAHNAQSELYTPAPLRAIGVCGVHRMRRVCARFFDTVVAFIIGCFISGFFISPDMLPQLQQAVNTQQKIPFTYLVLLMWGIMLGKFLIALMTMHTGASVGKRLFGLRTLTAHGMPLGWRAGVKREVTLIMLSNIFVLLLLWPMNPILSIFLLTFSAGMLSRTLSVPRPFWDVYADAYTIATPIDYTRWSLSLSIATLLPAVIIYAAFTAQQHLNITIEPKNSAPKISTPIGE